MEKKEKKKKNSREIYSLRPRVPYYKWNRSISTQRQAPSPSGGGPAEGCENPLEGVVLGLALSV